ncbi:hypothetical protein OSTOST_07454, partial [Ostertagia ostertagi]
STSTNLAAFERTDIAVPSKNHINEKKVDNLKRLANRIYEASNISMLKFVKTLEEQQESMQQNFALNTQQKEELAKELEKIKRKTVDKVQPMGDSIEEINRRSGVADALFQGDIILSREQQEQLAADIGQSRSKRQAYNDKTYPGRRWSDGVLYYLDPELTEQARMAFKKAAQLWMDDTCIDFSEYEEQGNEHEGANEDLKEEYREEKEEVQL